MSRSRLLKSFARLTVYRPWRVLAAVAVVLLTSALLIPRIDVTTSRTALVAPTDSYQRRLIRFFEDFGSPDALLLVVSGGSDTQRRQVVDALQRRLQTHPALKDRVLGRITPAKLSNLIILHEPQLVASLSEAAPGEMELADLMEKGLVGIFQTFASRLQGLGEDATDLSASQGLLRQTAALARGLDAYLQGEPALKFLSVVTDQNLAKHAWNLDKEGYLASGDGNHHIVATFPRVVNDEVSVLAPIVRSMREQRDAVLETHGLADTLTARVTGMPALAVDEQSLIQRGLKKTSLAAAVGIFLLFYLVFRSLRQTVGALIPLLAGTVATLGVVSVAIGELNLVTSSFVSVLMGLGIDFSTHFVSRFNETQRSDGQNLETSIFTSMLNAGPGILTGAITTALAFLSTATTEFTAFADLGVITSIGLILMLLATFLVLPASLSLFGGRGAEPRIPKLMDRLRVATLVNRTRWAVVFAAALASVAGAVSFARLDFNARYFDFLPAQSESAIALRTLEKGGTMSPVFANLAAESLEEARAMTRALREQQTVDYVESPTDLLPELGETRLQELRALFEEVDDPGFEQLARAPLAPQDLGAAIKPVVDRLSQLQFSFRFLGVPTGALSKATTALQSLYDTLTTLPPKQRSKLEQLQQDISDVLVSAWRNAQQVVARGHYIPSDLPELMQVRFVSKDQKKVAVYAYPKGDIWQTDVARAFVQDVEAVDPQASGIAINAYRHPKMILEGFERAAMIAAILVLFILLLDFRQLSDALLALVPIGVGWLWMMLAMDLLDLEFDVANIVCMPLVLGIGIDTGVHIVHRVRESTAKNGGVASVREVIGGTGSAVILAALTTMVGFAALLVADYGAMVSLGMTMVLGIACTLLACLVVLPAVLAVLGRAR